MAIIIPETIFKNAFVRKIHERTSRKERQQCMQQKLEKLQPREKMFFYAGHRAPRPPLSNLANSIFFPLCFYPNTLNGFGGGKKSLLMLLSFNYQVFNTISKPTGQRLASKRKTTCWHSPFHPYMTSTLEQVMITWLSHQSIPKFSPVISVRLQQV